MCVGSGIGPATRAPVRFAVSTMSLADLSRSWWSNARRRMRIVVAEAILQFPLSWPASVRPSIRRSPPSGGGRSSPAAFLQRFLLDHLRDDAGADRTAALANRKAHLLFET